ncbi:hypothetical protein [Escherichia coli]|uniref:hypothetical protein n=1 Tax=Escherichia coli TaxID=562 RepID=UPI003D80AC2F
MQDISLSDDLRKIEVKVSIKSDMKDALREETQFRLQRPDNEQAYGLEQYHPPT